MRINEGPLKEIILKEVFSFGCFSAFLKSSHPSNQGKEMVKSFWFPGLFDCFSLRLEMAMRTKHFNFLPVLKIIFTILTSFSHSDLGRSNLHRKTRCLDEKLSKMLF